MSTLADLETVLTIEPCPSCEAGHTYPGQGRHRCYTEAEMRSWRNPVKVRVYIDTLTGGPIR